jgi:hypothetical protein
VRRNSRCGELRDRTVGARAILLGEVSERMNSRGQEKQERDQDARSGQHRRGE